LKDKAASEGKQAMREAEEMKDSAREKWSSASEKSGTGNSNKSV